MATIKRRAKAGTRFKLTKPFQSGGKTRRFIGEGTIGIKIENTDPNQSASSSCVLLKIEGENLPINMPIDEVELIPVST